MWVLLAFGSALFAGATAILAKVGIRNTDSDVATALRTVVVLLFSWLMAWLTGATAGLHAVGARTWVFLALSGLATGASWLCYFRALQMGDVNKVTPIDKSSTVLTMRQLVRLRANRFFPRLIRVAQHVYSDAAAHINVLLAGIVK